MKLSAIPMFGATVVRGTRLLRVLHDHDVATTGSGFLDMEGVETVEGAAPVVMTSPQEGKDKARAKAGDLAVELAKLPTGEVLGYSYLTGEAITCVSYELAPHRYENAAPPVRLHALEQRIREAQASEGEEDFKRLVGSMIGICQDTRVGPLDVALFEVVVGDDYARIAESVMNFWSRYEPADEDARAALPKPDDRTCHLLGCVWRRKQKTPGRLAFRKQAEKHCLMHLQPPKHANDHAATPFQFRVLLDLADRLASSRPAGSLRDESST